MLSVLGSTKWRPLLVYGTYALKCYQKEKVIMVKYLAQRHKCHERDSNPHSAEQKHQSQSLGLLTAQTWSNRNRPVLELQLEHFKGHQGQVALKQCCSHGGRACPGLRIFAQHSEKNTLCCPTQISNIVHFALIWDTANDEENQMSQRKNTIKRPFKFLLVA